MELDYTVTSEQGLRRDGRGGQAGYRRRRVPGALAVHDLAATLAEKGFPRERVTIVEICNAKYSSQVLAADVKIGLMLPCPIMVYAEKGEVFVTTMRPSAIGEFFPEADIATVARLVEDVLKAIIDKAAG